MFCPYCGQEISETSKFCSHCGKSLAEQKNAKNPAASTGDPAGNASNNRPDQTNPPSNRKNPNPGWLPYIAIAAVVLCLAIILAISLKNRIGKSHSSSGGEAAGNVDNTETMIHEASSQVYENGDYTYSPSDAEIAVDSEACVIYYDDILLAYPSEEITEEEAAEIASSVDGQLVGYINGNVRVIQIQVASSDLNQLQTLADQLMESDQILYATYDVPLDQSEDSVSENDNNPWQTADSKDDANHNGNEENPDGNDWWAESIGAYTAWNYVDSHSDQLAECNVGIIDAGFDTSHEDLTNSDGTAAITMLNTFTVDDHGTHVAGIIGARNNSVGIRGIADRADLYCFDYTPYTDDENAANYTNLSSNTVNFAETFHQLSQYDRIVINNSAGKIVYSEDTYMKKVSTTLQAALNNVPEAERYDTYLQYVRTNNETGAKTYMIMMAQALSSDSDNKDFLIVKSAGNGYNNNGQEGCDTSLNGTFCSFSQEIYDQLPETSRNQWEAKGVNYQTIRDHIIIVSGYEEGNDTMVCSGYNYGENVDIVAPARKVYSTISGNQYEALGGTSMAAPIVTGSAALLWSIEPDKSAAEIKQQLIDTADTGSAGNAGDTRASYPMLNLGNAVSSLVSVDDNAVSDKDLVNAMYSYIGSNSLYMVTLDFDKDGKNEAFAYTYEDDLGDYYEGVNIYYCDSQCNVSTVKSNTSGWMGNDEDPLNAGGYYFFIWEESGGGSGSSSLVYGVNNGKVYTPAISGTHSAAGWMESSQYDVEGYYSDFSNGYHDYPATYYNFDESTKTFIEVGQQASAAQSASSAAQSASSAAQSTSSDSLDSIIQAIRDNYNDVDGGKISLTEQDGGGGTTRYLDSNGKIRKILALPGTYTYEYGAVDPETTTAHYFYTADQKLDFVYIVDGSAEYRFYLNDNGNIVRYIDSQNNTTNYGAEGVTLDTLINSIGDIANYVSYGQMELHWAGAY